jgi:hypothetical protein
MLQLKKSSSGRGNIFLEVRVMKKIILLLSAVLFIMGLVTSGPDSLYAAQEDYDREEHVQDEEKDNPGDDEFERMMKEIEDEEEKEKPDEEEQDNPDEKYQDDRG